MHAVNDKQLQGPRCSGRRVVVHVVHARSRRAGGSTSSAGEGRPGDVRGEGTASAGAGTACEPDERKAAVIPAGLRDALEDVSFNVYVDADRCAAVCGTITDDIIAQLKLEFLLLSSISF
ncbi:hypothetical protein HPB52_021865 [Rhipicephalus sanguineus]|uniref:Uncharacterized protein n=1 Tax=Rhipicephalus sanguineus TaxID=34632 RepID=A0A9D4SQV2_RHISA|nr:hypothetical protein HPB52_021865 [Rhipicephalus sanguineus]